MRSTGADNSAASAFRRHTNDRIPSENRALTAGISPTRDTENAEQSETSSSIAEEYHTTPSRPLPLESPWQYLSLIAQIYRSSTAMIFGNMLEFLDFGIYGYSEQEISQALFASNVTAGWATFGLGYAFRPLGAFVLGRLADSTSRHYSFVIAIIGMAASTAGLALLPAVCRHGEAANDTMDGGFWWTSYCVNAVWKTAVPAIVLRCLQGFSAGAAAGGVNVIQSEAWSQKLPQALAQGVGVNNVSGAAASLLSAALVYGLRALMGEASYAAWGWRLAFCIVIPPSLMAACLLTNTQETGGNDPSALPLKQTYEYELSTQNYVARQEEDDIRMDCVNEDDAFKDEASPSINSMKGSTLLAETRSDIVDSGSVVSMWLLIALSIYIQFAVSSYNNLNIYMVQYAKENYHVSAETATLMALAGKAVQLLMTPLAAGMADCYGWFGVCGVSGIGCAILAVPLMAANMTVKSTTLVWILVSVVLPMISTFWILNAPLLATSIFPTDRRSEGTSFVMAMGTALAGFFPLLLNNMEYSLTGGSGEPSSSQAAYVCGAVLAMVAALAAAAIFWIRRRAHLNEVIIYQRPNLF